MNNEIMIEKVRAGQPYLYRKNGLPSEVYEVRFKEHISNDAINIALQTTIERYPYFKVKYQEQNGDFYTVPNELPIIAYETSELPVLGGADNNYYLIAVSHYETHLYVSFHHGLTDGRGVKNFVETLVYYYCREYYDNIEKIEGILTNDIPYSDDEIAEPCREKYSVGKNEKIEGLSGKGFTLPETRQPRVSHRRYEMKFSQAEFMKMCKSYGGSPVTMLSVMMSRSIHVLYPDNKKVINSNFPVDVRHELGMDGTYKNCVKSVSLPYGEKEQSMSTEQLCAHYKQFLNAQRTPNHCKREFNNIIMLLNVTNHLHSYKGKRSIMRFLDNLKLDTYLISYIGKFNFGSNERYIDSVHLFSDCADGLVLNMTCACGYFNIDINQDFNSELYVNALAKEFESEKIAVSVSDKIEFCTPTDNLMRDMVYPPEIIAERKTAWQYTTDTVTGAYYAIEHFAVSSMTAVSNAFIKAFLLKDGETIEQAKQRLNNEQATRYEMQLQNIMELNHKSYN